MVTYHRPVDALEVAVATGWFDDPYGRHEARWMSGGAPTSLVRDGTVEQTDPLPVDRDGPDRPVTVPFGPAGTNGDGPVHESDLSLSDDAGRSPSAPGDEYRPPDFGTIAQPNTKPQRLRGLLLFVVGIAAVLGALYLIQTPPKLPTHRFTPSPAELAVVTTGGTAVPRSCAQNGGNAPADDQLGFTVKPEDAGTQFTVYPGSDMVLTGGKGSRTEFSASAPICAIDSREYSVERPGDITVYFLSHSAPVSVVKVLVTADKPPTTPVAGWVLLVLGGAACVVGVVLAYRRPGYRRGGNDFRRADDAHRTRPFDPRRT